MADHMSQMDMVMGHMSSCNEGQGGHCANALFAGMMHDVRTESDDHRAALQGAATLDAARTEESRHQAAMRDRLAGMRGQISAMPGQESTQHCSGM
jgi:hypothetical protein